MNKDMDNVGDVVHHHDLMELFEELSFTEKVRKVANGLKQPKDSGEYKYAKLQMIRLSSPVSAVVVPIICFVLLMVVAASGPPPARIVNVTIMEPESVKDLDKIDDLEEPPPPEQEINVDFTADVAMSDKNLPPSPATDFSPQPAEFDAVAQIKSPVIMKGIYGSRSPGARGSALQAYGGSGATEGAVLRALRWLKKEQLEDGSWKNNQAAMTGLALLAYLAHGETPSSEEFGPTVEKAIKWLVDNQAKWPRSYQHPIATYAICEAYALTKVPMLKDAAEKAADIIIKGQNLSGGFDYQLNNTVRNDTSVMGWCAQALKAAHMAGLEKEGLKTSMKKAIEGFKLNASPAGGFGYTGPGATGLTGAGVLCMQLLGAAREPETRKALVVLENATFNWEGGGTFNQNYYWYYITQAKFHAGGDTWNAWNKLFAPVLVKNQTIIKDGIMDSKGKMVDIGFWDMDKGISGHTDGVVMNTCLATLQLEVYYRYLPTYKPPEEMKLEDGAVPEDDIAIKVKG